MKRTFHFAKRKARAGFTLFELVIAITLMTFIVAMVFELLVSFLSATSFLQSEQKRLDQVGALRSYLNQSFSTVLADQHFLSADANSSSGGLLLGNNTQFLVIEGAPQDNGLVSIRMANLSTPNLQTQKAFNANNVALPNVDWVFLAGTYKNLKAQLKWNRLIPDLKYFHWRFYDRNDQKWYDSWTYTDRNPRIVECSFQLAGDNDTNTYDFFPVQLTPQPVFITPNVASPAQQSQLAQQPGSAPNVTPQPNSPLQPLQTTH